MNKSGEYTILHKLAHKVRELPSLINEEVCFEDIKYILKDFEEELEDCLNDAHLILVELDDYYMSKMTSNDLKEKDIYDILAKLGEFLKWTRDISEV